MTTGEILTFCLLSAEMESHSHMKDDCTGNKLFEVRMLYADKKVYFVYFKESEEDVTFIKGHTVELDPKIGASIHKLHGFAHLMKEIGCNLETVHDIN